MNQIFTNVDLAIVVGLLYTERYLYEFSDDREGRIKWFILRVRAAIEDKGDNSMIMDKINEAFTFGGDMSQNALVVISTQPCINEKSDSPEERIKNSQKRINTRTRELYKTLFKFTSECQTQNYDQLKAWWNNGNPI